MRNACMGSGGRVGSRTVTCGGGEQKGGDSEQQHARESEIEEKKGRGASHHAEQLRRHAGVEGRRRSSGIGGGTELERSSNGGRGAS